LTVHADRLCQGARTFRPYRHRQHGIPVPVLFRPRQIDTWFKSYEKQVCGASALKAHPTTWEIEYLDSLVRGVYANRDLPEGHILSDEDVYLAILQQGQISCRELMRGGALRTVRPADHD
jgi:N-acetylneuraminate synthase